MEASRTQARCLCHRKDNPSIHYENASNTGKMPAPLEIIRISTMEAPDVIIREAVKSDLSAIIELMKALSLKVSRAEADKNPTRADFELIFEQILRDPNRKQFVAEVDGVVVAAADLIIAPNLSHRGLPWAIIENVIVAERMRRRRIARKLVERLIETARKSGCYKIGLSSDKKRTEAHRLYESLNFDQYGLGFRIYF
jgi:GNAT superfamily N-acetyltransferase